MRVCSLPPYQGGTEGVELAEDVPFILRPVLIAIPPIDGLRTPEQVQRQRDYARRALRRSAELSGAPLEGWTQDPDGRPLPNDGWHWSISHKRQWAAGVVSRAPVGIDIEHVIPRRDEALFDVIADAEEWAIIGGRSWENFYRIWTAKEAVLKANGFGIGKLSACRLCGSLADARLLVSLSGSSFLIEHCSGSRHLAAVTVTGKRPDWTCENDVGGDRSWTQAAQSSTPGRRAMWLPRRWRRRSVTFLQLRLFPELGLVEETERRNMLDAAFNELQYSDLYWGFLIVVFIVGVICMIRLRWWVVEQTGFPNTVVGGLIQVAFISSISIVPVWVFRRRIQAQLRSQLNQSGRRVCMSCGYDLRGQIERRCPECGTAF